MDRPEQTTHFGFRDVPLGDKQTLVNDVFHSVASRYDLMNDLMSAGLHRAWKDALVTAVNAPKTDRAFRLLDVAGGTGDISFRVIDSGGPAVTATVVDINENMLAEGKRRAEGDIAGAAGDIEQRERRIALGRVERVDHDVFPDPVQARRHQIVHQVVA